MQPRSVLLFTLCLCMYFCGCRKKEEDIRSTPYATGLKGIVVYTSCATTVIRVTNRNMGVSWTNCHNQQRYENVFDAYLPHTDQVLKTGDIVYFDVMPDETINRCKVNDCSPSVTVTIRLR
ncbi:hypothetical protein L3C95_06035 [Chitinophaga filiformis]|uniref:hypothetical protein n=1 Tax=Chitinophaga filiformis TaxID=104663 RepID=UPI001F23F4CE|nr:hypothetical protein [Chitinophaga filiformis]MCF6402426.1 hypothetical protein [Chitinophaga filiformis]